MWKKGNLEDLLTRERPDILAMRELKIRRDKLRKLEKLKKALAELGYPHQSWHTCDIQNSGYSGVAIISRRKPQRVELGWVGGDAKDVEGRVITGFFDDYVLVNTYVLCSGMSGENETKRQNFNKQIKAHIRAVRTGEGPSFGAKT